MNMKTKGSIILHSLWNTKDWEPHLQNETLRKELFEFLKSRGKQYGVCIDEVNGGPEHVHCLFLDTTEEDIKPVVRSMKKDASKWLKERTETIVRWETDYLIFQIKDDEQLEHIRDCIKNQKEFHNVYSFVDEYNSFISGKMIKI